MDWIYIAFAFVMVASMVERHYQEKLIKTQNEAIEAQKELIDTLYVAIEVRDALFHKLRADLKEQGIEFTFEEGNSQQRLDG